MTAIMLNYSAIVHSSCLSAGMIEDESITITYGVEVSENDTCYICEKIFKEDE